MFTVASPITVQIWKLPTFPETGEYINKMSHPFQMNEVLIQPEDP